ncbi:hypothetical protein NDU88_005995 [Pleurodeles waltl]|uniref:Uncharacterized protein n=1 Tax=Pleurodeles waltl TaxID=8319 RepID=A0AAV7QHH1_PLEWA|nr:hypothetical protein NDU88_005995 [Pleurodeles waltl]
MSSGSGGARGFVVGEVFSSKIVFGFNTDTPLAKANEVDAAGPLNTEGRLGARVVRAEALHLEGFFGAKPELGRLKLLPGVDHVPKAVVIRNPLSDVPEGLHTPWHKATQDGVEEEMVPYSWTAE